LGIEEPSLQLGLGRSIYTDAQMNEFFAFQNSAGARSAYLADQTERAYNTRVGGEWGLGMGERAKEMIIDHVGWSFIPMYQIFGPLSMLFLTLVFVVGLVRIVVTLLVRTIVLVRAKGCGVWVLSGLWGTAYQLVITPIRWADATAEHMAREVEQVMTDEANNVETYPMRQLREVREEARPLWDMAAGVFRGRESAPPSLEAEENVKM
jgi:hypothetical protein